MIKRVREKDGMKAGGEVGVKSALGMGRESNDGVDRRW